ncbi:MAG: hypothetical protein WDW38_006314 [Sanguina aurantia]
MQLSTSATPFGAMKEAMPGDIWDDFDAPMKMKGPGTSFTIETAGGTIWSQITDAEGGKMTSFENPEDLSQGSQKPAPSNHHQQQSFASSAEPIICVPEEGMHSALHGAAGAGGGDAAAAGGEVPGSPWAGQEGEACAATPRPRREQGVTRSYERLRKMFGWYTGDHHGDSHDGGRGWHDGDDSHGDSHGGDVGSSTMT